MFEDLSFSLYVHLFSLELVISCDGRGEIDKKIDKDGQLPGT